MNKVSALFSETWRQEHSETKIFKVLKEKQPLQPPPIKPEIYIQWNILGEWKCNKDNFRSEKTKVICHQQICSTGMKERSSLDWREMIPEANLDLRNEWRASEMVNIWVNIKSCLLLISLKDIWLFKAKITTF